MVKEEWKQIITFPNYKISNYGNVISLNYRNTKKEKLMSINVKNDYPQINFINGKIKKSIKIHRLVALYFLDNPNNYTCINHIDGNKTNNHYSNLEWCNYSQNIKHAHKLGLNKISDLNIKINKEKRSLKVIDTNTNIIYSSIKEAAEKLNYNIGTLNDYLHNRRTNKTTLKLYKN